MTTVAHINEYPMRLPAGVVYIGRGMPGKFLLPSPVANPFHIGRDGTREEVIAKFETWLMTQPRLVAWVKRELKGAVLVCWCRYANDPNPNITCHGQILARIAEEA